MATRPKAVIESRNGEKFSPITITKNVLTDDGQNLHDILSDRKEDMMTPTIENSSSMFKVGQGDNVDYSSNVINSAYESMVLKGKTMVNCIQESSSQDVVLPYEFEEGRYVTINDTKESGALGVELKGQTLVNATGEPIVNLVINSSSPKYLNKNILKKDTVYTFIYDIEEVTGGASGSWGRFNYTDGTYKNVLDKQYTTGITKVATSFNKDLNNLYICWIRSHVEGQSVKLRSLMILEGDWTNKELPPYFTGMTSCKMPILHTVGKNLLPNPKQAKTGTVNGSSYSVTSDGLFTITGTTTGSGGRLSLNTHDIFKLQDGVKYVFVMEKVGGDNSAAQPIFHLSSRVDNTSRVSVQNNVSTFTYSSEWGGLILGYNVLAGETYNGTYRLLIVRENEDRTYEPHKSSILSTPSDLELHGIGDVQDTLDCLTGEVVERIGEIVFDGSENISDQTVNTINHTRVMFKFPQLMMLHGKSICSHTPIRVVESHGEWEYCLISNDTVYLQLSNSKLETPNVDGVRKYMAQQYQLGTPITIHYQLAEKVVKTVDLKVVDQNGNVIPTLKSWNTTTHIYSEIPESTLYPTLSHSNPAYPVILKPSTKYSIVANSYSNNHTNSTINFNLGGATASTTVGNRVTTITTPSTLSNELLTMSGRGNKLNNVMVIEGDVVGDEPYFTGLCDCKSPILSNVGKNLFDANNQLSTSAKTWFPIKNNLSVNHVFSCGMELPYIEFYGANSIQDTKICYQNWDVIATFRNAKEGAVTSSKKYKYLIVAFDNNKQTLSDFLPSLQVEILEKTAYEPYKSNILSCETYFDETTQSNKTIVLRSLPNGVCDTLNVETGEYVQRIGEIVFDGSEGRWDVSEDRTNTMRFNCYSLDIPVGINNQTLCTDKFPYQTPMGIDREGSVMGGGNTPKVMIFGVNKSRLTTLDSEGFKSWLSQNPVTVQYELATPVVSTIDVQGFPYAYTNGHIQLTSGSIEQSLTPKVEYSVATNRNGQIRSNQKMVERHQKQLDRLQAMILTNLVNTQYEQTLTNLKYDLKNVREEVK